MSKGNMKSLKDILGEFSEQKKMHKPIVEARIVNHWKDLMGALVDRYTDKIYVNNRTLFVKVSADALRNELLYSKEKIILEMNKKVGEDALDKLVIL